MEKKIDNNKIYHENDCLNTITLMTINDECDILRNLLTHYREPNLSISLMPYCALFCVEVSNRFEDMGISLEQIYGPFSINVMRARLKLMNDKMGKVIKLVESIHHDQDLVFREKLRFAWMGKLNFYYNLGITFYNNKIMGNTYFFVSLLDKKDGHYPEPCGPEAFKFAKGIGQTLAIVNNLSSMIQRNKPDIRNCELEILFKDINVNRRKIFAIKGKECRALSILLLNVLGNINFANYLVEDIIGDNTWKLRVQYISMYYAKKMMSRVAERTEDMMVSKRIKDCMNHLYPIFNQRFRSCMMHYSFAEKGQILIKEKYFDIEKPLYGLVDSCFDGKSYKVLSSEIKENLLMMENMLDSMLLIDCTKVKKF